MIGTNYLEFGFPSELWLPFATNRPVVRCGTGHLIYIQETDAHCFYYLKAGKVKSFIQSEDGDERVLHIYNKGAIFGEASFFDELPRVSSAMALEPCEVVSIDRELVAQEFARDPNLAIAMLKYLSRTVRLLSNQVDDMAFRPAPQRVARYLLTRLREDGTVGDTQDEIAAAISSSRVTVSRILSKFMKDGWLETGYGKIVVKDRGKLEQFGQTL
ncbi:MAG: Crp/Fnr family transcriptional regulator [Eubacteriales bacterium]